ncbi:MAG TPA: DinB family protein [Chitinophagaceae bacterium]|nr:DinB family protein [Chitinophagaceae bacterium]
MRKLFVLIISVALMSFIPATTGVSKKEKKDAAKFLKESQKQALASVKGLSEAQLKFKPAPDRWSVEDCMKHIAATEIGLWQLTNGTIGKPANPEKRSEIKMTDDDVKKNIEDRTNKVKTFPPFEPQNTGYKTLEDAINSFKENRGKLMDYIKTTDDDLRNHVAALPFGSLDCYQMVLFIGAHTMRHVKQMEEVKADPNFPKN